MMRTILFVCNLGISENQKIDGFLTKSCVRKIKIAGNLHTLQAVLMQRSLAIIAKAKF